ncbi:MAG: AAA family ATPase [Candidatus Lokiarchaeota archaeon]|nr:AAA family ATPase [Candidatus Lokiarchaeota archaeon]
MALVVTLGGLHGTGKSSVADRLAKEFNLRRVSAGQIFRGLAAEKGMDLEEFSAYAEDNKKVDMKLDARLKAEAKKGNVILDGQLAAWMAGKHADLRILLTAPLDIRVQRIADRDETTFEDAKEETLTREESERERYKDYYGIDISDHSVYDLILNTEIYPLEGVVSILSTAIRHLDSYK